MDICLPHIGQAIPNNFFPKFHLCPDHRDNMEVNTYPAVDLPVYGEADGAQQSISDEQVFYMQSLCKLIFLLLQLCWAVASKVFGFYFSELFVWVSRQKMY